MRPLRFLSSLVLVLLSAAAFTAHAQGFPNRPIRIIVPFPAGGTVDAVIRPIATSVSASLGQPVVIDNRPGGNTFIGMAACAKSAPDGYTLCSTSSDALAFGKFVFNKIPYDPQNDLVGVTKLVAAPSGLFISAQLPFHSASELFAYAKANPGKLNFASFGSGSIGHLYVEWFRREMKIDMTHVPYRGSAPIIPALISNEAQVAYLSLAQALPHVKTGKIKAVAIDYPSRVPQVQDVPTVGELKIDPGMSPYFGLYGPAGIPPAVIERLNQAFTAALRDPKLRDDMAVLLFFTAPTTVDELQRSRRAEVETASAITRAIGLKPLDLPE
jgi:tripartite-type tricarboxylate transporter receptor subunit TctC